MALVSLACVTHIHNSSTSLPPPFICSTCIPFTLGFHHSHHFLDLTLFENHTSKLMNPRSVYTNTQTLLIYCLDTHPPTHPPTHQCLPAHPSSHLSPRSSQLINRASLTPSLPPTTNFWWRNYSGMLATPWRLGEAGEMAAVAVVWI